MKSRLYAVRIGECWEWHWSIHLPTVLYEWFERYGADTAIIVLEPPISLGQAMSLANGLNSRFPRHQQTHRNAQRGRPLVPNTQELLNNIMKIAADYEMKLRTGTSFKLELYVYEPESAAGQDGNAIDPIWYERIVDAFRGRSLLIDEVYQLFEHIHMPVGTDEWMKYVQSTHLRGDLEITNGLMIQEVRLIQHMWRKSISYSCRRCGSGTERMFWSPCVSCGGDCPYCEECLTMGRARYCSLLVLGGSREGIMGQTGQKQLEFDALLTPWGLSPAQSAASLEGLRFLEEGNQGAKTSWQNDKSIKKGPAEPRSFLIWAVTGAGKTEMIFPFIQYALSRGGKVLVATPRKDVVLELRPRIAKAFANHIIVTLYGGSDQRWEQGDITLATTHQLMRFHEAYDLVIIDEIDAFPYHNNPVLEYAARKVCKQEGTYILLSATPPPKVRKAADRGKLPHVRVPVRFHRHPLPVPEWIGAPAIRQMLKRNVIPAAILRRIQASVDRGAQVFIFVPNIKWVEPLVQLLIGKLRVGAEANGGELIGERGMNDSYGGRTGDDIGKVNSFIIAGTSSQDEHRTNKVQRFRDKQIRVLVTTTILERGVTIPKSDVFIIDADSRLFDEAALVQMAGRAGRSKEDPAGKVYFAAKERTQSQSEAIRQIKRMNRLARRLGYFKGGNS